jgi:hypothetical protein
MRHLAPRRPGAAAAALLALAPAAAHAQDSTARRAFTPADVYRILTVAAPTVSPDGRRVAFTVTRVDERANRRRTEVWTAPVAGGAPERLSWPDSEATAPRFLPDGRLVFSVGSRGGGRPRTYAVRPGDGTPALATGLPPAGASYSRDGRVAVWADSIVPTADSARGEFTRADSAMRGRASGRHEQLTRRAAFGAGAGRGHGRPLRGPPFGRGHAARWEPSRVRRPPRRRVPVQEQRPRLHRPTAARRAAGTRPSCGPPRPAADTRGGASSRPRRVTRTATAALRPTAAPGRVRRRQRAAPDSAVQAERDSLAACPVHTPATTRRSATSPTSLRASAPPAARRAR